MKTIKFIAVEVEEEGVTCKQYDSLDELIRAYRHNDERAEIGRVIKQARKSQKISQQELGKRAGIDSSTVCDIENGNQMAKPETLKRIYDALSLDLQIKMDL